MTPARNRLPTNSGISILCFVTYITAPISGPIYSAADGHYLKRNTAARRTADFP